jgi:hypothetical protein
MPGMDKGATQMIKSFEIGDKVVRGNGSKVFTVTAIKDGAGVNAGQKLVQLNGRTTYDARDIRLAE